MSPQNRVAFVTVVEPIASLQGQVLLLAESLRRWGGRLADAPIICVSPRFHLPLRRSTLARFEELGITYIDRDRHHPLSWYAFINKPLALLEARRATDAEHLVWLDADAVVLDEPDAFLEADSDFAATLTGGDIATTGPSHPLDAYWGAACDRLGVGLEALPRVEADGHRVRYCIQAGVFRARRLSPVLDHYLANLEALMDSRVVPSAQGLFFLETMALALAPLTSGATWSELPRSHNHVMTGLAEEGIADGLESARVLHHHCWLHSEHRSLLLSALGRCRPDRRDWLQARLSTIGSPNASALVRLLCKGLLTARRRKAGQFLAGCRAIETGPRMSEALGR